MGIGAGSSAAGYLVAREYDASIAGSMSGAMGVALLGCWMLSPRRGLLATLWRRSRLRDRYASALTIVKLALGASDPESLAADLAWSGARRGMGSGTLERSWVTPDPEAVDSGPSPGAETMRITAAVLVVLVALASGRVAAEPSLESIVERLRNGGEDDRVTAAYELQRMRGEAAPAVPALLTALRTDPAIDVRAAAAHALMFAGKDIERAFEGLFAAFKDPAPRVRAAASWALGQVAPATYENQILDMLMDKRWEVRAYATRGLGQMARRRVATKGLRIAVMNGLSDPSWYVRNTAAIEALELPPNKIDFLAMVGKALLVRDSKAEKAETEDVEGARIALARMLGHAARPHPKAVNALAAALAYRSEKVRIAVAEALEKIGRGAGKAAPALAKALRAPELEVRRAVAKALIAMGPDAVGALKALRKTLADREVEIRVLAACAVGAIGPGASPAVRDLRRLLRDKAATARKAAAEALAAIGPKAELAVAVLEELFEKDPSEEVRYAAGAALRAIYRRE